MRSKVRGDRSDGYPPGLERHPQIRTDSDDFRPVVADNLTREPRESTPRPEGPRPMSLHRPSKPVRTVCLALAFLGASAPRAPGAQGPGAVYDRAEKLRARTQGKVFRDRVIPHWFANNDRLWYRLDLPG